MELRVPGLRLRDSGGSHTSMGSRRRISGVGLNRSSRVQGWLRKWVFEVWGSLDFERTSGLGS